MRLLDTPTALEFAALVIGALVLGSGVSYAALFALSVLGGME